MNICVYIHGLNLFSLHLLLQSPWSPSFLFESQFPSFSSSPSYSSFPFFPQNFHHLFFLLSSSVLYFSLLTGSVALRGFRSSNSSLNMKVLSMSSADSCQSWKHSEPCWRMSCTAFGERTEPSGRRTMTVGRSLTLNMARSSLNSRKTCGR